MNENRGSLWTLAVTTVAFFMVTLDALVVITALPALHRELGGDLSALDWTVNAYLLTFAAGIVPAAALGDRFGRRAVYGLGLLLFAGASAACALAPGIAELIAARAVQGLGAAVIAPLSLTLLTSAFPATRRGAIVGIWGGVGGLAVAAGPLVGGAVTQGLSWHWIFWVNVPIGVAAAILARLVLARSPRSAAGLDLPGSVLVAAGAGAAAWGLVRASTAGWLDPAVLALLALGLGLLAGFAVWESRAAEPMMPLRLFRAPGFGAAVAVSFLMTGSIISAAFLMSEYFQLGLRYSPLETGLRFLPWTATPLVVAPLAGVISDRIGRRGVMAAGLLLQAVGLTWVAVLATNASGYAPFIAPLVLAGVGVSMALPLAPTAALSAVHPTDLGKASGVTNTLQRLGGVFAVALVSAVFGAGTHLDSAATVSAALRPALEVSAGLSLLGGLAALAVVARRPAVAPVVSAEVAA
ncbi:MAG TPA: DHA2 family efflux MFS transporter permease subunit [Candidatus Dormibacteraeota bacterium]